MMDYVRHGKYFKRFVYPPACPTTEELEMFGSDLSETILDKVTELTAKADELAIEKEKSLQILTKANRKKKLEEFDLWFWTYWTEVAYSEYFIIQKWLRYWLEINNSLTGKKSKLADVFKTNGVSQEELEQAKKYPLEKLYQGELRHSTGRLSGCCPFHEEKTPSFVIYENENRFHCFGCHAWGDPIDFVMKLENLSLIEAVKKLI